jgi:hypothetical protein
MKFLCGATAVRFALSEVQLFWTEAAEQYLP